MIDLAADRHGHAIDYACDLDRRYFAEHPHEVSYTRAPIPHEMCMEAPAGPCWALTGHVVQVIYLSDGVRIRRPVAA